MLVIGCVSLALANTAPRIAKLNGFTETTESEYIARLNYGFLALKNKRVCAVDGYVSHTFHVVLPVSVEVEAPPQNVSRCNSEHSRELCLKLGRVVNSISLLTVSMRRTVKELLDKINRLVPDVRGLPIKDTGRRSRGLIDGVGYVLSFLFGTSTESDVSSLTHEIDAIKGLSAVAAADGQRTREGFASFSRLMNERMDGIHTALAEDHVMLSEAIKEMKMISAVSDLEYNAISYVATNLARFVVVHDAIQQLGHGVEELIQGHLSPSLVAVEMLEPVLTNVSEKLQSDNFKLCYTNARDVYNSRNFDVARHGQDLFIRLRIPFTRSAWMSVLDTNTVGIPVPGKSGWVTTIKDIPKVIVVSPDLGLIGELKKIPDNNVLNMIDIIWHSYEVNSCLFSVIADETNLVKEFCDFNTRQKTSSPSYLRLTLGTYALSDYKNITIMCTGLPAQSIGECNPCLITVGSGCKVMSKSITIVERPGVINISSISQAWHAVNLIVLQHFYDTSNLTITGKSLMSEDNKLLPEGVNWKLYGEKVTSLLAADDTASYSLKKLASNLQNESVVFHTPAEAILSSIIHEQAKHKIFGIELSVFNAGIITALVFVVVCLVLVQLRTRRELTKFSHSFGKLGVTAALLNTAKGHVVLLKQSTTIIDSSTTQPIIEYFQDNTVSLVFTSILFFIMLIIVIITAHWIMQMRSYVYIEVKAGNEVCLIKHKQLPDASRCFHIIASKHVRLIVVDCFCFGYIKFTGKLWKVEDNRTQQRTSLPRRVFITHSVMKRVQSLLKERDYQTGPVVVHTHECVRRFLEPAVRRETASETGSLLLV
jgi:hypothetical protein